MRRRRFSDALPPRTTRDLASGELLKAKRRAPNATLEQLSKAICIVGDGDRLAHTREPSPERQTSYLIDLATRTPRADGQARRDLQEAGRLTRTHRVARDLLQLSGPRPRPELRELAERFGILPWHSRSRHH